MRRVRVHSIVLCLCVSVFAYARNAGAQNDMTATAARGESLRSWCTPQSDSEWATLETDGAVGPLPTEFTFRAADPDGKARPDTRRVFAVSVPARNELFPRTNATGAMILSVVASGIDTRSSLLAARVYVARDAGKTSASPQAAECVATESPSPIVRLLMPAGFEGYVEVLRLDASQAALPVRVALSTEDLRGSETLKAADDRWFLDSFSRGHAIRATLTPKRYAQLVAFARCEYLATAERRGGGCVDAATFHTRASEVYDWMSEVLGRSAPQEFSAHRGSRTEPIIAFFGLANVNQMMLLDCRATSDDDCREFSEPWETSLQRAEFAWAVYLEETQTGFDTAIDIEFKPRAPEVDYEEFDPRAPIQLSSVSADSSKRPTIRIGFRRIRIREAPTSLVVAFTRQGPGYGVRQYQRAYFKLSSRRIVLAASLVVTPKATEIDEVELESTPPPGFGAPTTGRITRDVFRNWVYTAVSLRWPTVRARAADQPNSLERLGWQVIPDITVGRQFRQGSDPYFLGASWPLWFRLYATFGASFVRSQFLRPGFGETQLLPLETAPDVFSEKRWTKEMLFGLSVDLIGTR